MNFFNDRSRPLPAPINAQQAAQEISALHAKKDGSTFSLFFGDLGGQPLYSVSPFTERTVKVPGQAVTPSDLTAYIKANRDALARPHAAVGTWYDPDNQVTYLDIVIVIEDKAQATELGVQYNQIGIFDLGRMEFIPTGGDGAVTGEALKLDEVIPQWQKR